MLVGLGGFLTFLMLSGMLSLHEGHFRASAIEEQTMQYDESVMGEGDGEGDGGEKSGEGDGGEKSGEGDGGEKSGEGDGGEKSGEGDGGEKSPAEE